MDTIELIAKKNGLLAQGEAITASNCWDVWGPSFKEYLTYIYDEEKLNCRTFRPNALYYTSLHKDHTEMRSSDSGINRFERNYKNIYGNS